MTREIKFRVWDKKEKTMHKLWLLKYGKDGIERVGGFWNDGEYNGASDLHDFELMQFTGLKDKNGKEIFESDLVKYRDAPIQEVVFEEGSFRYRDGNDWGLLTLVAEYCEVIGNIYENPELLTDNSSRKRTESNE